MTLGSLSPVAAAYKESGEHDHRWGAITKDVLCIIEVPRPSVYTDLLQSYNVAVQSSQLQSLTLLGRGTNLKYSQS